MRRAAHIVWLLLAVLVRQSGLCALLPGTVLPQAALATPPAPLSGNRSDTVQHVELSFRFDRSLLDSAYRDNSSALHTLRNWLGPSCCASRIDSIGIFSYSSMEGYGWHNGQLARDRGRAVKGYLVWKYPHLNQYRIYIHPQGEDWAGLLRRLSDMPDLPSRDQIANLFDAGLSEEELKNRFRILIDSQSYRYLQSTLFPSLRRAIVRIYWKDSVPDVLTARIRSDAFSAAISEKTAVVLLNSPNNPSGVILSRRSITKLAELLEKKSAEYGHRIYIVADEPYRELAYDGEEVPFIPAIYKDTIYCYSFSKTLSLPGERIGFLAIHPELTDYARVRAAIYGAGRALGYINASTMFQLVAAECVGQTADISVYKQNRDLIHTALLDMGYTCVKPSGAFYLFLKTPEPDATAFCKKAMALDLLVVPGDEFGCPGYVRLAYCVPKTMLERSLPRFRQLADQYGLKK